MRQIYCTLMLVTALAGCAAAPEAVPGPAAARNSDPALLALAFGPGGNRPVALVIRCGMRCPAVQR